MTCAKIITRLWIWTGPARLRALKNALKHINLYTIELPEWLKYKRIGEVTPVKTLKTLSISVANIRPDILQFLVLKRNARRIKFWQKSTDKRPARSVIPSTWSFTISSSGPRGLYQMESIYHKGANYCYAWIKGKVVDLIAPDSIKRIVKRFTKEWIKSKSLMDGIDLLNKINTSNQITEGNLETIDEIKLNFKNHSRDTEYINFRNGSIRITRDKIERV